MSWSCCRYKRLTPDVIDAPAHRLLARWAASRVIVLLQNRMSILPLNFNSSGKPILMVGPNADNVHALWGDYAGKSAAVNVTARMAAVGEVGAARVRYAPGCLNTKCANTSGFSAATNLVNGVGAVIAVMGTQGNGDADEIEGHDRLNITLPGLQEDLLEQLRVAASATNAPLIVVLMSGGAVSSPWADTHADAVLWAGFNGEFSGTGLFDVLSGRVNPGARLPYTVPASLAQIPDISECVHFFHKVGKLLTESWKGTTTVQTNWASVVRIGGLRQNRHLCTHSGTVSRTHRGITRT